MAGSTTVTRQVFDYGLGDKKKLVEKITVDFVGDALNGSVPNTTITLKGFLQKVVTNPGSTAPTDNWDVALGDPSDTSVDALAGVLQNRDTTTTEIVYPAVATVNQKFFLLGDYSLQISGNSVNSATGRIEFFVSEET